MGHERIGILPRRKKWRDVVRNIQTALGGDSESVSALTARTLDNVRLRYRRLHQDRGVQAAFSYLVALTTSKLPAEAGLTGIDTDLESNPSPLRITRNLIGSVNQHIESTEYAELACRAAADTIAMWSKSQSQQKHLFDDSKSASSIWSESIDGRAFCTIAHTFFSSLTSHYLRYFIDREASAEAPSLQSRERLERSISKNIDDISQHAFETAKITKSFAAGWFNKRAKNRRPTDKEVSGFLAFAFGKLQEEIKRESVHK